MQYIMHLLRLLLRRQKFLIVTKDGAAGTAVMNVDYSKSTGEKNTAYYVNK